MTDLCQTSTCSLVDPVRGLSGVHILTFRYGARSGGSWITAGERFRAGPTGVASPCGKRQPLTDLCRTCVLRVSSLRRTSARPRYRDIPVGQALDMIKESAGE